MSDFFKLFLTVGVPKMPFLGLPIICFVIVVDFNSTLKLLRQRMILQYYFFSVVSFVIGVYYTLFSNGTNLDVIFLVSLLIKFLIAPHTAYYIYNSFKRNQIGVFILLQTLILSVAVSSPNMYDFLLLFQSSGAADLFGEIKDKRGLSFGLLHNEGAMFIALMFYLSFIRGSGLGKVFGLGSFAFLMMSRLTGVLIFSILLLRRPVTFLVLIAVICLFVWQYHQIFSDLLIQAFEPLVNLFSNNGFYSATFQHMIWMLIWPSEMSTWIFGDGKFFSASGNFYMGTDLGFLRIIYFSGFFGLAIFSILNIWPLIRGSTMRSDEFMVLLLFMIGMIKGLNPHPWMFFLIYFLRRDR